jgi:arylsulfatase A-like enzyme
MIKRYSPLIAALAVFLLAAVYSAISIHRSQYTNVLIVSVESLREDLINRTNTPALLEAAESGTRFTHHRAISGWTGTNIVSLLTGLSPFTTGVHTRGQKINADHSLPLHLLNRRGYQTEGFQAFMVMDIYQNLGLKVIKDMSDLHHWLSLKIHNKKPFFGWYHYVHTHLPYASVPGDQTPNSDALSTTGNDAAQRKRLQLVRENYAIHYNEAQFQEEDIALVHDLQGVSIQEFDTWFAKLWKFFDEFGLRRNTILVLTADHGDEHGERGYVGHASTTLRGHLHEEIVRIPLFIWLPDNLDVPTAQHSTLISTHEDVMATILDLLNQPRSPHLKGRNLFETKIDSEWVGMTSSGGFGQPDPMNIDYFEYAILSPPWKLRMRVDSDSTVSKFLYNLEDDPHEHANKADMFQDRVEQLSARLLPLIQNRTILKPNITQEYTGAFEKNDGPDWIRPSASGVYAYDDLDGNFILEWDGTKNGEYVVEYVFGRTNKQMRGSLEVKGTQKDFGQISRRYWNTWVVPNSPVKLRVRPIHREEWSEWLHLEARP